MVFGFTPESRSPSTGFPTEETILLTGSLSTTKTQFILRISLKEPEERPNKQVRGGSEGIEISTPFKSLT
jgi:hypothetical protein